MGIIKLKNSNEDVIGSNATDEQLAKKVVLDSQPKIADDAQAVETWDDPAILHEKETQTDENSRHYVLNNGTAKSVLSAEPVNYFDEEEKKWKYIDNTLVEKDDSFESNSGKIKTKISKTSKGKSVKVSKPGRELSWEYLGKQSVGDVAEISGEQETILKIDSSLKRTNRSTRSRAIYENVERDTDLEYCLHGNNLKENIIVKERSESYRYLFALKTEGLKLRLSEDNENLELYSEIEKEDKTIECRVEFTIPSPYMYDANGVASDDVYYELEPQENGRYAFAVVASEEWMNATERAFPVTIDPQIVTNNTNLVTKQTYYRNIYTTSSSGTSYSGWYTTSYNYIRVQKASNCEYKTSLNIKKSQINLMDTTILRVKLILSPYGSFSGYLYFNGSSKYYSTANGKLELDMTSVFKSATGDFAVTLTPYSYVNMQFLMSDEPPVIEIEYLTNENVRPTKKRFTLAGIATGEVNLANGSMVTTICDVKPEDSVMGLGIYHIHKKDAENYALGGNFRLNLNESLIRVDSEKYTLNDVGYVYTDVNGDKHAFRDYYYYIDNLGEKVYVDDKSKVVIDAEGKMTCNIGEQIYSVACEYKSTSGLKAMTTIEGVKNANWYEQRQEDVKQVDEQVESYYNALKDFVAVDATTGSVVESLRLKDKLDFPEEVSNFIATIDDSAYLLMSESEALNYRSLILQAASIANQIDATDNQLTSLDLSSNSLYWQKRSLENTAFNDTLYTDSGLQQNTINPGISSNYQQQINLIDDNQLETTRESRECLVNQQTEIGRQQGLLADKKNTYLKQIENYYREYCSLCAKQKQYHFDLPVNFLSDGKIIKGYNAEGVLVAIYDRYENYIAVEYESYYVGEIEKKRIVRAYDNTEKQVVFSYNESNQLTRITDVRGRNTCFTYNSSNQLIGIVYDSGANVVLAYSSNNIYSITETKKGLSTYIYYSYNRPVQITHYSTVDNISLDAVSTGSNKFISQCMIAYVPSGSYPITNTTVTENLTMERYFFDNGGNCTGYRKALFDSASQQYLVSEAENYTHNPYWIGSEKQSDPKEVVVSAAKSSLNITALDSYSFVAGDTETTHIDQFNNPTLKETNNILVSKWTDGSNIEQQTTKQTTVSYEYDENQKLICETTTVTYSNPSKTVVAYKKYQYNAYGDIIRTESYVAGEEYTTGKNIEETVYDDKGNVVKSFSYNSLDTSSKFYSETEYDESGKVTAELDETGENKTKFVYKDGTNVVCEEQLPNGSKFAYGHDSDDSVTAISQSTEEGEENSTQRVYRSGELVELKSGNNKVKYAYNHKRKLKSVELNGEQDYVTYNYVETTDSIGAVASETVTATYKSGDVFVAQKDGKGNVLQSKANGVVQVENTYDKKNNLVTVKDKITGKNYQFERDELDRLTAAYEIDNSGIQVSSGYGESSEYDEFGALKKRTIVGPVSQVYNYAYKTDAKRAIERIAVGNVTVKPKLDIFDRNKGKELLFNDTKIAEENISYRKVGDHATQMPSTIWFGDKANGSYQVKDSVRYAYDKMGNIEKVYENGELAIRYHYDALNRLVREDNKILDKTVVFVYDNNGNIVKQRQFVFTLKDNTLIEELESTDKAYIYDGDKLLSFNGQACAYDVIGNPTTYRGKTATWAKGRQLVSYDGHTFTYDGQGRRLTKDGISYTYDINGKLLKQSNGLEFFYDHTGVAGIIYNGNTYLYRKDVLGNILAILDGNGGVVARYIYDAWGNHSVINANGAIISDTSHIANLNPFRYRGYYFDTETKLYFLKTRYYDAEIGRFMTIDDISYINSETINGLNLYSYCGNNPVTNVDPNGNAWWHWLVGALVVVAVAALVVVTAGAAAVAIGATAATVNAVMIGAAVGGLVAGGTNLIMQGITTNWQTVDFGSLALSTFVGGVSGAISSGFGQLSVGVTSGTRLLAHKGFQTAVNVMLSWGGYAFSSAVSGEEMTLDGFIFATVGGFISGVTFNWATIPALGLLVGLEFTGYTRDIIDYIRNSFNRVNQVK